MSNIYTDDNVYEALEKVAGRAGSLVRAARQAVESNRKRLAQEVSRQANPKTLKQNLRVAAQESGGNLQSGLRALQAQPGKIRGARESLANFNRQFAPPKSIPTAGNASARALQRSKQSAKPLASRGTFGPGGNKVKVASDDNIHAALEKVARVFGANEPDNLHNAALSYKKRRKKYKKYLMAKSKEKETPWSRALITGGALGAVLGPVLGTGLSTRGRGLAASAALGAVFGTGIGAFAKMTDDEKIRQAQKILKRGKVDKNFQKRVLAQSLQKERSIEYAHQQRHDEMMRALKNK